MNVLILGIDCATRPQKMGFARARARGDTLVLEDLQVGAAGTGPVQVVADMLGEADESLLAMDAPLGWPEALGPALATHTASLDDISDRCGVLKNDVEVVSAEGISYLLIHIETSFSVRYSSS